MVPGRCSSYSHDPRTVFVSSGALSRGTWAVSGLSHIPYLETHPSRVHWLFMQDTPKVYKQLCIKSSNLPARCGSGLFRCGEESVTAIREQ